MKARRRITLIVKLCRYLRAKIFVVLLCKVDTTFIHEEIVLCRNKSVLFLLLTASWHVGKPGTIVITVSVV